MNREQKDNLRSNMVCLSSEVLQLGIQIDQYAAKLESKDLKFIKVHKRRIIGQYEQCDERLKSIKDKLNYL